jgi:hypothetical protein
MPEFGDPCSIKGKKIGYSLRWWEKIGFSLWRRIRTHQVQLELRA